MGGERSEQLLVYYYAILLRIHYNILPIHYIILRIHYNILPIHYNILPIRYFRKNIKLDFFETINSRFSKIKNEKGNRNVHQK